MTRVLIVEDSPTQAEQLRIILESNGFEVETAVNGEEALDRFHRSRFDMVITDILMPGISGYDVCRKIKSEPEGKQVPVILLTTLNNPMEIVQGLECGADNFITKPYAPDYLLARIRSILDNKRLRTDSKLKLGVEIFFLGRRFTISSDKEQILGLLISTFEDIVQTNRELHASQRELARKSQTLNAMLYVAEGLNRSQTEREMLETVLERAMRLPDVMAGWISLREGEGGFRLGAARNLPPALSGPGAFDGPCLCRRKALSGELGHATNMLECERLAQAQGDTRGLRHHASVPIWIRDRMLGILNLVGAEPGLFSDDDLEALNGVGNQIGIALERARLYTSVEQQGRVSEEKYRQLMERANDAVFIFDPRGKILEVNRQAEAMLGRDRTEILGRSFQELVISEEVGLAEAHFREFLAGRTTRVSDIHLLGGSRAHVCVDLSASLMEIEGERIVLAIARDVTERNQLERQFRQSQKMEAIGQLAGGVAHDFNNVLTAILGYGVLMADGLPPDHALQDDVREIRKAAEHAATLTKQLLTFSRQQVLLPEVLDLNGIVTEIENMLQRLIGEDVELFTNRASSLGRVKADRGQIEQVLMNLVVNARDAMPKGGKLTLETSDVELDESYARDHAGVRAGPYVLLAVSDTGVGMDEDTLSHMFEPFFTTKEKGKGTGLGLATVYGIVKQSGGQIWVYSELGRGTTFKVYLPRVEAKQEAPRRAAPVVAEDVSGSETILLVEDEEAVRRLVRMVLEGKGYGVLEASGWQAALEIAGQQKTIHLVITDVVMPGVGGPELASRLEAARPGIRVLFMSGYTDSAVVNHGLLSPVTAFLQKPFTPDGLTRKVREVLSS